MLDMIAVRPSTLRVARPVRETPGAPSFHPPAKELERGRSTRNRIASIGRDRVLNVRFESRPHDPSHLLSAISLRAFERRPVNRFNRTGPDRAGTRMAQRWGGKLAADAAEYCKRVHGWTCWLCGYPIAEGDYTVDHVQERSKRPDLIADPANWRPAHGMKHPEYGCPGNFGRSGRKRNPRVTTWVAEGW